MLPPVMSALFTASPSDEACRPAAAGDEHRPARLASLHQRALAAAAQRQHLLRVGPRARDDRPSRVVAAAADRQGAERLQGAARTSDQDGQHPDGDDAGRHGHVRPDRSRWVTEAPPFGSTAVYHVMLLAKVSKNWQYEFHAESSF